MMRWVRAVPVVLISALAVLSPATGARAAASDPAHSSGADLEVTPVGATGTTGAGIALEVDPGASVKRSFIVANRSSALRITVRLAGVDATVRAGGVVKYASGASADGPGSWLTLSDVVTTLEPGTNVRVSLTVTPPDNATPGDVTAGLVARVDDAARASDNGAVDAPAEVSLPIAIKVNGAPTALVSVASVTAVKDNGRSYLDITFQNSGATPATMSGQVRVSGTPPRTDPIRVTVPPLTHTNVRVPFALPSGAARAPVSVSTTDAAGNEATWGGEVGFAPAVAASAPSAQSTSHRASSAASSTRGSSIPLPAIVVVALVFLAAAVWFVLEIRRNRAGRRAARVRSMQPGVTVPPTPAPTRAPAAQLSTEPASMGAVASQLGALVDAIDRLVSRLGEVAVPVAGSSGPASARAREAVDEPLPANPAPMFYAPAASRGAAEEHFDPYDWPTQEQLDQFAARRRAAQSDM
jgi:hypothetical protein